MRALLGAAPGWEQYGLAGAILTASLVFVRLTISLQNREDRRAAVHLDVLTKDNERLARERDAAEARADAAEAELSDLRRRPAG